MEQENQEENKIESDVEECKRLKEEYLSGWQREKADFINYKKEEGKRLGELVDFIKAQWVLELLKIVDNFDRAIKHKPDEKDLLNWIKGVEMIDGQLKDFLKSEGVEEIKALGEKFDPKFHEVIEETDGSEESGEILEVLEKGYTMNGKVIRASKAKVVK